MDLIEDVLNSTSGHINVSVANLHAEPRYKSEIISQGILGETVRILDEQEGFRLVRLPDEYEGWVSGYQVALQRPSGRTTHKVFEHFATVYQEPDRSSRRVRDVVLGCLLEITGQEGEWSRLSLPDGLQGWIRRAAIRPVDYIPERSVTQLALPFLGYPYLWGGKTPKGFDCSGLIQTVFGILGKKLPRDSWMQHRDGQPVGQDPLDAAPGDLYFFAEHGDRITHVGLALGAGDILHARGWVRINSMAPERPDFSRELIDTFVDVRTYLGKDSQGR